MLYPSELDLLPIDPIWVDWLKETIRKAADMHEQSWNGTEYTISKGEAARLTAYGENMADVARKLLERCWNDALSWASQ